MGSPEGSAHLQTEKRLQQTSVRKRRSVIHRLLLRQKGVQARSGTPRKTQRAAPSSARHREAGSGQAAPSRGQGKAVPLPPAPVTNHPELLPGGGDGWAAGSAPSTGYQASPAAGMARHGHRLPRRRSASPAGKHCTHLAWQGRTVGRFIEPLEITLGFCPARIKGACERWLPSPNLHLSPNYPTRSPRTQQQHRGPGSSKSFSSDSTC